MTSPAPLPAHDPLAALAGERFVALTTFRRTGRAVATTVWIARDGDRLLVTTPADSGKVKRLRNDPRVELRPCSRRGAVPDGAVTVTGTAEIVDAATAGDTLTRPFAGKYGFEYRLVLLIERIAARRQRERVLLRIAVTP